MKPDYRKKALSFVTALLLLFLFAQNGLAAKPGRAAAPSDVQGQPSIHVGETTFDFGEVMEGTDVEHDYIVRNTGTGVLGIERVKVG